MYACAQIRPPSPAEFHAFQELVLAESGLWLSEAKQSLLAARLARRLRDLGLTSFGDYHQLVSTDASERVRMIDLLCTHETHFFREPRQFEYLERELLPGWRALAAAGLRPRSIRAWSAACSTGEEPYSLAMTLLAHLSGWQIDILATDLSTRALERAEEAVWPLAKAAEIPVEHLKSFMLRGSGSQQGRMKAGPEIRALVRFERLNLIDDAYAVGEGFDLILCRNVLIYFDAASKKRVLDRLARHLLPDGRLLLGHAESAIEMHDRLRSAGPNVYARSTPGAPGATP